MFILAQDKKKLAEYKKIYVSNISSTNWYDYLLVEAKYVFKGGK